MIDIISVFISVPDQEEKYSTAKGGWQTQNCLQQMGPHLTTIPAFWGVFLSASSQEAFVPAIKTLLPQAWPSTYHN